MPRVRGFKWDNRLKKQYVNGTEITYGGTGGSITSTDTPPSAPAAGDTWFDTSSGALYIYYDDGSSQQWVGVGGKVGAQGPQGPQGPAGADGAAGPMGSLSRETFQVTTASIADGASAAVSFNLSSTGYLLYKIETDAAAWVRLYTDVTSRTNDNSRTIDEDAIGVEGLLLEVVTTGAQTVNLAPGVVAFNNENPATDDIPITVINNSGASTAITVTITAVQIES